MILVLNLRITNQKWKALLLLLSLIAYLKNLELFIQRLDQVDLNADPIIGGNVTAIRKSLERLVDRGLIQIWEQKPSVNGGRPTNYYKAILVRGDKKSVALNGKPSDDNDLAMRQADKNESCRIGTEPAMGQVKNKNNCRIDKPLPPQESTSNATGDSYSPRVIWDKKTNHQTSRNMEGMERMIL